MEVHHHPDLHHKPKKFKEYFLEFIMIFLAVVMGFIAEKFRENDTDREKEKQYMKSMLADLRSDSAMLNDEIKWSGLIGKGMDSLSNELYKNQAQINVMNAYRIYAQYARVIGITFSDQTTSQLKAGGMRLIRKSDVASEIADYWQGENTLSEVTANCRSMEKDALDEGYSIFNHKYIHDIGMNKNTYLEMYTIDSSAGFMTKDTNMLVSFSNKVDDFSGTVSSIYTHFVIDQFNLNCKLIALIRKEYDIE